MAGKERERPLWGPDHRTPAAATAPDGAPVALLVDPRLDAGGGTIQVVVDFAHRALATEAQARGEGEYAEQLERVAEDFRAGPETKPLRDLTARMEKVEADLAAAQTELAAATDDWNKSIVSGVEVPGLSARKRELAAKAGELAEAVPVLKASINRAKAAARAKLQSAVRAKMIELSRAAEDRKTRATRELADALAGPFLAYLAAVGHANGSGMNDRRIARLLGDYDPLPEPKPPEPDADEEYEAMMRMLPPSLRPATR